MITVRDLMDLFLEDSQDIVLWDTSSEREVYVGRYCDMPSKFNGVEIMSVDTLFNPTTTLTINIELGDDFEIEEDEDYDE